MSDRNTVYARERMRVEAFAERIDTQPRTVDGETYHIWTKKLQVSKLGRVKVLITQKDSSDEAGEKCVKYIVSNKIDTPECHLIVHNARRCRIESFFRDTKQDPGLEDCELRSPAGASRHCHLLMFAYSLLKLGVVHSALLKMDDSVRV